MNSTRIKLASLEKKLSDVDEHLAECSYNTMMNIPCDRKPFAEQRIAILEEGDRLVSGQSDSIGRRSVELWKREYEISCIEHGVEINELKEEISKCICEYWAKSELGYTNRQLILSKNDSEALRREAWEVVYPLTGLIESKYRRLFSLRNTEAIKRGYGDYSQLIYSKNGFCSSGVMSICKDYIKRTEEEYKGILETGAKKFGLKRGMPWNTSFLLAQSVKYKKDYAIGVSMKDAVDSVFTKLGYKVNEMPIRIGFKDIPYGAVCISFRPRGKTIVLINECQSIEEFGYILHELTHALQNVLISPGISYVEARGESLFVKEGVADFIRCLITTDSIEQKIFGITGEESEHFREVFYLKRRQWLRRQAIDSLFECMLYKEKEVVSSFYDTIVREHMGVDSTGGANWMTDLIFTTHPAYLHNYVFGEYLRSGLESYFRRSRVGLLSEDVGSFLTKNVFTPAGSIPWSEKTAEIGESVDDYASFARALVGSRE